MPQEETTVGQWERLDALVVDRMAARGMRRIADRGWRETVGGDLVKTFGTRVVVVMHRLQDPFGGSAQQEWRMVGGPRTMQWQADVRRAVLSAETWVRRQTRGGGKRG